jgi:hypothetical protein
MRIMSGVRNSFARLGIAFMALVLTGCASYRINTSLKPSGAPVPGAAQFNLTDVRYVVLTNVTESGLSPFTTYRITGQSLGDDLMAAAMATYPETFSTAPDAIPLQVTITCLGNASEMGPGGACVSCLTLTIYPMRSSDEDTYSVETRCEIESVNEKLAQPTTFKRTDVSWLSITPTGWIPVPAKEGDRVLGMDGAIAKVKSTTLKACVEAVAISLRRVKPEAWTDKPAAPAKKSKSKTKAGDRPAAPAP